MFFNHSPVCVHVYTHIHTHQPSFPPPPKKIITATAKDKEDREINRDKVSGDRKGEKDMSQR